MAPAPRIMSAWQNEDYRVCRGTWQQALATHGCAVDAYAFMTNHVDLLLAPEQTEGTFSRDAGGRANLMGAR
jgi:hypothetical protein